MNKLPFVWELNSNGVISNAIGSPQNSMVSPDHYTQDILHYLDGKSAVLVESPIPHGGTLDAAIVDIARAMELTLRRVAAEVESEYFYRRYSPCLENQEAAAVYKRGDESEMKNLYGAPIEHFADINGNIARRSARLIATVPSLLVVNLAHLLFEPSLLALYQKEGIKIKRVQ